MLSYLFLMKLMISHLLIFILYYIFGMSHLVFIVSMQPLIEVVISPNYSTLFDYFVESYLMEYLTTLLLAQLFSTF